MGKRNRRFEVYYPSAVYEDVARTRKVEEFCANQTIVEEPVKISEKMENITKGYLNILRDVRFELNRDSGRHQGTVALSPVVDGTMMKSIQLASLEIYHENPLSLHVTHSYYLKSLETLTNAILYLFSKVYQGIIMSHPFKYIPNPVLALNKIWTVYIDNLMKDIQVVAMALSEIMILSAQFQNLADLVRVHNEMIKSSAMTLSSIPYIKEQLRK